MGGDFNFIFDVNLDKKGTSYNNARAMANLSEYMDERFFIDIWRVRNPEKFEFKWIRKLPNLVMSCLDPFLITSNMAVWVQESYIKLGFRSDHLLVGLVIEPFEIERGRDCWKFSTTLLDDEEYCTAMQAKIDDTVTQTSNLDDMQRWKCIKLEITGFRLSLQVKRRRRKENV